MEGLLQGLSSPLRLAAVTCEALLGFEVAVRAGFGLFWGGSYGRGHGALLCSGWVCGGDSLPKRIRHIPPHVCENGVTRSHDFLLSFINHVRYKYTQIAVLIPTSSSAHLLGIRGVGDDF